jgi:4'-phosphopantetheinyl transferase
MPAWPPPAGEVHVVHARLDVSPTRLDELRSHLAAPERERAAALLLERDRERYVAGRGLLRELLAELTGSGPETLTLLTGRFGRPGLAQPHGEPPLRFSASRSGDDALYAFTRGRDVGADIERAGHRTDIERVAARYLSVEEHAELAALPEDGRPEAFLAAWVRREAYLKAIGTGLARSPRGVELDPVDGAPGRFAVRGSAHHVQDVDAGPEVVAAVAAAGTDWRLVSLPGD